MTRMLFTVFDSAARAYLQPFFSSTVEEAIRSFREAVNTEGHQFNKFPEDYALYCVGEFDQATGVLKGYNELQSLGVAITYMARPRIELTPKGEEARNVS